MEGSDVLMWQRQIIQRGWTINANGTTGKGDDSIFSKDDHDVLIKFQQEKGLKVDGKIGPKSWNAAWLLPVT
jgi:murein L,D-transpeptidase YcbB/YkuD